MIVSEKIFTTQLIILLLLTWVLASIVLGMILGRLFRFNRTGSTRKIYKGTHYVDGIPLGSKVLDTSKQETYIIGGVGTPDMPRKHKWVVWANWLHSQTYIKS